MAPNRGDVPRHAGLDAAQDRRRPLECLLLQSSYRRSVPRLVVARPRRSPVRSLLRARRSRSSSHFCRAHRCRAAIVVLELCFARPPLEPCSSLDRCRCSLFFSLSLSSPLSLSVCCVDDELISGGCCRRRRVAPLLIAVVVCVVSAASGLTESADVVAVIIDALLRCVWAGWPAHRADAASASVWPASHYM